MKVFNMKIYFIPHARRLTGGTCLVNTAHRVKSVKWGFDQSLRPPPSRAASFSTMWQFCPTLEKWSKQYCLHHNWYKWNRYEGRNSDIPPASVTCRWVAKSAVGRDLQKSHLDWREYKLPIGGKNLHTWIKRQTYLWDYQHTNIDFLLGN